MSFWSLFYDFLDLCFPQVCLVCGGKLAPQERFVCTHCLAELPETYFDVTERNKTRTIFEGKIPIVYVSSYLYFKKASPYKNLIYQLKYNNKPDIGIYFGHLFGRELKDKLTGVDYIVPVPLHPKKEKLRGYNQAERFAVGLSERLQIPVDKDNLYRTIFTETQTKKTKEERWENVKEVFALKDKSRFQNKHIALVDDVITTGSTIEASAQTILNHCDAKISVLSIGIAD